jgi:hypothetical protein
VCVCVCVCVFTHTLVAAVDELSEGMSRAPAAPLRPEKRKSFF